MARVMVLASVPVVGLARRKDMAAAALRTATVVGLGMAAELVKAKALVRGLGMPAGVVVGGLGQVLDMASALARATAMVAVVGLVVVVAAGMGRE